MKTFTTSGTGGGQTLLEIETDKIPIYETKADADADLANLAVGQIIGIKDTGDELAQAVDVVEERNLHAVSSNAVASLIKDFVALTDRNITSYTCPKTGIYNIRVDCYFSTTGYDDLKINNIAVGGIASPYGSTSGHAYSAIQLFMKKGDILSIGTDRGNSNLNIYGFYEFDILSNN